ncbi:hypothetical protein V6N13_036466 [Hibiscus sabdariffa]
MCVYLITLWRVGVRCWNVAGGCWNRRELLCTERMHRQLVVEAELWGIYSGLVVTWEEGYRQLIVETDCKDAIDLIYSREGTHASLSLVLHIQALFRRDWCVVIQYVPRSLNSLADGLAKLVVPDSLALVRFQTPPVSLHTLVDTDSLA